MGTYKQKEETLLERLASYASAIPHEQDYLKSFVRRLVENPGSLTVRDIGIVCGLTQSSPEDLLELSLCWSEVDMALEMEELAAAHKE